MCTTIRSPVLLQRRPDQLRVRHDGSLGHLHDLGIYTQGGGPDLLSAVTGVAISALKAGWWHKWQQAMRIRPEAVGGLLEFCKNNAAKCEGVPGLRPMYDEFRRGLKNMTLAFTGRLGGNETLLLATQYPEGSPTHPAWPAGHATVAGACVTVLKAMLNTHTASKEKLPWPAEKCTPLEAVQKKRLPNYKGADKGDLTIVGELNKLASTAALGATLPASTSARTATRGWRSVSRLPFST